MHKHQRPTLARSARAVLVAGGLALAGTSVALTSVPALAAGTGAEVREETAEAGRALRDYTVEQKDRAVEAGEDLLESIDARLERLAEQAGDAKGEAARLLEERRADLVELRAGAAERLDRLRAATRDGWEAAKAASWTTYEDLSEAVADSLDRSDS